jgi:RecA-family ATPase
MAKGVIKFMQKVKNKTNCGVEMVNHIGKSSSKDRDASQFSGRGGTALPSHSRVVKTLYGVKREEFKEASGYELTETESGLVMSIGKFTDRSSLMENPNYLKREGYCFNTVEGIVRTKEEKENDYVEIIYNLIKQMNEEKNFPTKTLIIAQMKSQYDMSKDRTNHALTMLQWQGYKGNRIDFVSNPDPTKREQIIILL